MHSLTEFLSSTTNLLSEIFQNVCDSKRAIHDSNKADLAGTLMAYNHCESLKLARYFLLQTQTNYIFVQLPNRPDHYGVQEKVFYP